MKKTKCKTKDKTKDKTKGNELTKVSIVAVLSIGLFSAAFVATNNLAFAAAADKVQSMPPVVAAASLTNSPAAQIAAPDASGESQGYRKPELSVYDATDKTVAVNPNAISAEEAAELGAQYIWDMFGESIDGKAVVMTYCVWPSHTKAYWLGEVAETKDDAENNDWLFNYYICAVSGERADIYNMNPDIDALTHDAASSVRERQISKLLIEFTEKYRLAGRIDELDEMFAVKPTEEQLEEYGQLAKDYAAKHFIGTEVASIVFIHGGSSADIDEDGNIFKTDKTLTFKATDSSGRCADVCVAIETRALLNVSSSQYDIVPGYNYDAPGVG